MKTESLVKDQKNCCGCGLCSNACPKHAITMQEDCYGFLYPRINETECIDCGICKNVCPCNEKNQKQNFEIKAYAAMLKNYENLKNSASGGVFFAIASRIIKEGGIVYGCSMHNENGDIEPTHIRVNTLNDLRKLQGSKYVQSNLIGALKGIEEDLKKYTVLFAGTPCQVAAVKKIESKIKSNNLLTIDIICHGVPSLKMFKDYIDFLEKKLDGKIIDFKFRDKTKGWGLNSKVVYLSNKTKKEKYKLIPSYKSSYYYYFLKSVIYRENCYHCKYANENRVGDITIGDYWGFDEEHKELLKKNGGKFDYKAGISCILVNNERGTELLNKYTDDLVLEQTTCGHISKHNMQLKEPSKNNPQREVLLDKYKKQGYKAIEDMFKNPFYRLKRFIIAHIPFRLKKLIKNLKNK